MKKIKILAMTATRADYPRVKKVLEEINKDKKFNLKIAVTGAHLLKKYGNTYKEILKDGFKIYKKFNIYNKNYDTLFGAVEAINNCSKKFGLLLNDIKPDMVLLTVDRIETLGAAIAASVMNYPIIHVQGGEVTGTIDENIRHAITKLSHIHMVSNKDAQNRVIKLGEKKDYVFNVGCPFVDLIKSTKKISKKIIFKKLNLDLKKKTILLIQHAVTTEYGKSKEQIIKTITALKKFNHKNYQVLALHSNADPGSKNITQYIENNNFKLISNIESKYFISLMYHSDVLVGNSSVGIREAPSFKLPSINIGSRQNGRLRTKNVIDVAHNTKKIYNAINKALFNKKFRMDLKKIKNPYGNGDSSIKIVKILKKLDYTKAINKIISY